MSEPERFRRAVVLFREACALDVRQRDAFLNSRCGADAELRDRVRDMLDRDAAAGDALESAGGIRLLARHVLSPSGPAPHVELPEGIPTLTGHYRIIRVIGEGGMGVVYEAEQAQPRRTVALKMIRSS